MVGNRRECCIGVAPWMPGSRIAQATTASAPLSERWFATRWWASWIRACPFERPRHSFVARVVAQTSVALHRSPARAKAVSSADACVIALLLLLNRDARASYVPRRDEATPPTCAKARRFRLIRENSTQRIRNFGASVLAVRYLSRIWCLAALSNERSDSQEWSAATADAHLTVARGEFLRRSGPKCSRLNGTRIC